MVVLRVKQGRIKKKGHESLKILPKDLLVEIFSKVASHSIADICKVKLCCKEFLHAAEDNYVYQHASMDKFALVPLQWFTKEKESSFLNRCRENGNLEILYQEGMVQYFTSLKVNVGFENLKNAALKGHDEAKYVYCMLLMCGEDQQQRNLGFDLFRSLKTSTYVRRCRERVESFIRSMWMNNPVARNRHLSLCHSGTCKLQKLSKRLSPWVEDEDDGITCEYCNGDYELNIFCNMFRV